MKGNLSARVCGSLALLATTLSIGSVVQNPARAQNSCAVVADATYGYQYSTQSEEMRGGLRLSDTGPGNGTYTKFAGRFWLGDDPAMFTWVKVFIREDEFILIRDLPDGLEQRWTGTCTGDRISGTVADKASGDGNFTIGF